MRIDPITTNGTTSFRAKIQPTKALREGLERANKSVASGNMKDMNHAKEFIDSISRISDSKEIPEFKIEIDKRREGYTYTRINGRRVHGGDNEHMKNVQDSYLVIDGTKRFAAGLEEEKPYILDSLKAEIEKKAAELNILKERYRARLIAEIEGAQKLIFGKGE